jgi:tripartite-type tricarboxylate transporter receptor subunit TctC
VKQPNFELLASAALLCLMVPLAAMPLTAFPQSYPSKPIRIIVPFPPGGGVDLTARIFQQRLSGSLGQPVVIDNRPGATGAIGADTVLHSAPDGYTMLYTVGAEMVLRKYMEKKPAYQVSDFTPIAAAVESVSCLAVGPLLRVTTIRELLDYARRNPGKLNYGTTGIGSTFHLTGEALRMHGIDIVHVPFKGVGPAMTALLGGQIEMVLSNLTVALPPAREGKVKILALTQSRRFEGTPDIPTLSEALPGFEFPSGWYGFFGPGGMPAPIVARLNAEIMRATEIPEVVNRFRDIQMTPVRGTPEQFAALVANSAEGYGRIIKAAGIQPE